MDYSRLDHESSPIRIRLNSTAVAVRHVGDPASSKEVEVLYARDQKVYRVRGKASVLACWNMVIPFICPELPEEQKQALRYGVKVPLVYTVVALRNWKAFHKLGIHSVSCPGHVLFHHQSGSGGQHRRLQIVRNRRTNRSWFTCCARPASLDFRPEISSAPGTTNCLTTPFETFERNVRDQLTRVLGGGGFDAARDIEAITVNRWPHGYAYEYNPLWDPDWPEGKRPCDIARQRLGRIAIANSDAAAAAYTDQAIDQGYRAVQELLSS